MRNKLLWLALAASAMAASPAGAQQLYRCGNVYSQTPCAADAAPVRPRSSAAPDAAPGAQGAELCSATATRELGIDDSAPIAIAAVTKAPAEVINYADKPTATRKYIVAELTRRAYAPYDGPRSFACHLSEDERRVLKFGAAR